jgi:hypothetical protein
MKQLVVFLLLIISVLQYACEENSLQPSISSDDQVRETIFRYQIQHYGSGMPVMFLSLMQPDTGNNYRAIDPSDDLVGRIKADCPEVKKYTQSYFRNNCYYDVDSNQHGMLFSMYPLQWSSSTEVQVDGGYYYIVRVAGRDIFYLHKQDHSWIVDSVKIRWVI